MQEILEKTGQKQKKPQTTAVIHNLIYVFYHSNNSARKKKLNINETTKCNTGVEISQDYGDEI